MTHHTVTAKQGSQPTVGSLRVGIMDAVTRDGLSKARLLLRPASGDHIVVMTEGESLALNGIGVLVLERVENAQDRGGHPLVTISLHSED